MRELRSCNAGSIAVGVGFGMLSGRMARASRARSTRRRSEDICGRAGMECASSVEIELLEDGEDSESKRAERMAESFGVRVEVCVVAVIDAITETLDRREMGWALSSKYHLSDSSLRRRTGPIRQSPVHRDSAENRPVSTKVQ